MKKIKYTVLSVLLLCSVIVGSSCGNEKKHSSAPEDSGNYHSETTSVSDNDSEDASASDNNSEATSASDKKDSSVPDTAGSSGNDWTEWY